MAELHIRTERPEDREEISRVEYAAFLNHPQHQPGALPTEHRIVDLLRAAGELTLSLVCDEEAGEIVGHIAFSPVLVNGEDLRWSGLGPVAVLPDRQGQGIGSALINAGISRMKDLGAAGIVLVGDPGYYVRFGFRSRPELTLDNVPPQSCMCLPLEDQIPSGRVTFHKAFGV